MKPSPLKFVLLGAVVVAALGLTVYAVLRPSSGAAPGLVEPLPPPKTSAPSLQAPDAATVARAPTEAPDAGAPAAAAIAPDAGQRSVQPVVVKRGISPVQLKGRIALLEKKLEVREAPHHAS